MRDLHEYLTVAEVATLLRVHRTTVWRWIACGELPAYRVGRRALRIRRADLEAFLKRVPVQVRPEQWPRKLSPLPWPVVGRSVVGITGGRGTGMYPARFAYDVPGSVQEAVDLLGRYREEAKVLAGGQSLIPLMKFRLAKPARLVDINRIPGLNVLEEESGVLRIGALVRHRDVERSAFLRDRYPLLASAAPQIADPLVRNLGTVVGSVCHADPQGDWGSVMLALDAEVVAQSTRGERRIPVSRFFAGPLTTVLEPDELVTELRVPQPLARPFGTYLKLERKVGDYATVGVAVHLELEDGVVRRAGIGLTSVGPTSRKAQDAEAVLIGKALDADVILEAARRAASAADPTGDVRGSAQYKREVVRVFVTRALRQARAARAA